MDNITEQKLIEGLCNNDREAMKNLYLIYAGYLSAICSRYVSDREKVKDLLQDIFIRIYTSIGKFEYRGEGSLKAWMSRITVNETLKFLRCSLKKDFITYSDNLAGNPPAEPADEDLDIDDIPASVIHDMIRRLPTGYRTVFNLYVFEEKSHKEIAALLDIKENSSASQFHRAKAMLAQWIKDYRNR